MDHIVHAGKGIHLHYLLKTCSQALQELKHMEVARSREVGHGWMAKTKLASKSDLVRHLCTCCLPSP